jgi:NAD-dependent DNA ligase/DNA polymerase/3'-5' exonuclease PolX
MQSVNSNSSRYNESFIEILEKLSTKMLKQGEPFRARAYQKAQEFIMTYPGNITKIDDIKGKPNIGPAILEKLTEFLSSGTLQVIEDDKNNPVNILSDVYGIGPKKAQELVGQGITTIAQLRANQHILLNDTQIVGLKYYEDILKRIPRSEIEDYNAVFKEHLKDASYEIVGSYRRGLENSGDIDIIITSNDSTNDSSNFIKLINILIKQKIIIEVLSQGVSKCLVISRINPSATARRVDFLYASKEEYPFSILYFTGSKIFNTVMRNHALTLGLTMNEHGLYKMENKKKGEKVNHQFLNEKDIFKYLNMEYKEPQERVDGRAFKLIQNSDNCAEKKTLPKKQIRLIIEDEKCEEKKEICLLEIITTFKKFGINALKTLTENEFVLILKELNKLYYNETSMLTDNEYDIIKDLFDQMYPLKYCEIGVGSNVEKNKATLPYYMGSMDKIKPDTNALLAWTTKFKGPYVLSCKLDGVSGLYTTEGNIPKLYTRGDGKVGQDISYLIPYLNLSKNKGVVIRGEFIMKKKVFELKYKNEFANPRNMVAGVLNQKFIDTNKITDINFVAYEVIRPILKPAEQMEFLTSNLKMECVINKLELSISNELLSQNLLDNRNWYEYEIDGIIVTNNNIYERKLGNPEHSIAFKMVLSEQMAEASVIDVIWTPSKDGYLKPRVQILPVILCGVKIEYATGFNGAFIQNNKIGIGAVIKIIRSGDVIPHILNITVPAQVAKMPDVSYKWNSTNVDIMLENIDQDITVREKNIAGFFKGIEVDGIGLGNVSRIIEAGFNTIPKIINMSIDDFLKVEGFKTTLANKIYNGIKDRILNVSLIMLMASSNLFGRGFSEKKIELIMNEYPDILTFKEGNDEKIKKVLKIKGIAEKSATIFVDNIAIFMNFIMECKLEYKVQPLLKTVDLKIGPLNNKTIVITGFRDKNLEEKIKDAGAKLGASVSKNTFLVIVKNMEEDTGKVIDAKKIGIKIITVADFNKIYFL